MSKIAQALVIEQRRAELRAADVQSALVAVARSVHKVSVRLALGADDAVSPAVEREWPPDRIREYLDRGRADELPRAARRRAILLWNVLEPAQLDAVCAKRAPLLERLRRSLLARYVEFQSLTPEERWRLTTLLAGEERDGRLPTHSIGHTEVLLSGLGLQALQDAIAHYAPTAWCEEVENRGVRARDDYARLALCGALRDALSLQGFSSVWQQLVGGDNKVCDLLVPGSEGDVAGGRRDAVAVRATSALLESAALASQPPEAFYTRLFDALGDPVRLRPDPMWARLAEESPRGYDSFIAALSRADIEFFFEEMGDRDRKSFWLRYVPSMRRTQAFLRQAARQNLRTRAQGKPELERSTKRIRVLRTGTGTNAENSAFAMYFDHHVVVEFGQANNATYVYDREVFDSKIAPLRMGEFSVGDLKQRVEGRWWVHRAAWQNTYRSDLAALGVMPGKRRQ